ncbi:DNA primase [Clostridium sp. HCP1S3_B4]|uniref:DNA primase n=1 Tax=unclassified Clostridium TaxID=2614128 RepID=UPI002A77275A|nr:DNA primase [Clostridiales bacterium]MDY2728486.1 DNA primase [Clostridium sp.]
MRISEEIIQKVKEENDIVDVISETVNLKRSGRNYIGLCPFHNDKSPSLSVSPDKQIYKCFSCGEAGNVITFVMKQKNYNFIEAIKSLAERANIVLHIENSKQSAVSKKKDILYKINVEAARYYFKNLTVNNVAKEYFSNRGIKNSTIRKFGLGYAKEGWTNIIYYLKRQGYNDNQLIDAGLVIKNENKGTIYDRFRNRVMFPVFDIRGKVIGFGGRVFDDSKPKYLNSPETLVFHKGVNLYGLNFAVKDGINDRTLIIVEGYMDCISLHQYGITNAIASLGTALTVNQARLIKRYADKVVISYDADIAGQKATLRGLDILKDAGLDVRVLLIPQGKDPDEFVRLNGKEAFLKLVYSAISLIEYRLKRAAEGIDFNNNEMVIKYVKRTAEIFANVDSVEKDIYIKKIAEDTGLREQSIYDLINKVNISKENQNVNKKEENRTELYLEPAFSKAEKAILKLMLNDEYYNLIIKNITEEDFFSKAHKDIFKYIIDAKNRKKSNVPMYVESLCDDVETSKEFVKVKETQLLDTDDEEKLINDCINKIKKYKLSQKLERLKKEQKELERKGKIEESIKLAVELSKVSKILKNQNIISNYDGRWDE